MDLNTKEIHSDFLGKVSPNNLSAHFGEHQLLELLCGRTHCAVALSERITLHALVLQVDDGLAGVPAVVVNILLFD